MERLCLRLRTFDTILDKNFCGGRQDCTTEAPAKKESPCSTPPVELEWKATNGGDSTATSSTSATTTTGSITTSYYHEGNNDGFTVSTTVLFFALSSSGDSSTRTTSEYDSEEEQNYDENDDNEDDDEDDDNVPDVDGKGARGKKNGREAVENEAKVQNDDEDSDIDSDDNSISSSYSKKSPHLSMVEKMLREGTKGNQNSMVKRFHKNRTVNNHRYPIIICASSQMEY